MAEGSEEQESVSGVIYTPVDPKDPSKGYRPKPTQKGIPAPKLVYSPLKRITHAGRQFKQ